MTAPGNQLLKMVYQPTASKNPPTKALYEKNKKEFENLFKALDEKLGKIENGVQFTYLTGNSFYICDIVIYSEI